ncbi:Ribonuclease P/MRP, subunit POP7 [Metarhizium album ARSEF 1941]|uniref:Ribonuclease P/MRP, subunit POP7 n=1 Tax=Metarhizium album (strain ARSEF 1941) TaxID=1081103 RepID=A0A0B2WVW5_METAS|nr:Ribonuclease P/MRP, subunit POP7 [Metarhizium album ARSEF 1941]KHO00277.1 Ribonuclease P/MRP, subunit POP7 [Metarhizium album ARSEF 1941]
MAKTHPPQPSPVNKNPPIPQGCKIQKRPLNRPQVPSSSKSPVIYISSHTPFLSAVSRVRKLLTKSLRNTAPAPKNASTSARVEALQRSTNTAYGDASPMLVTVLGTGKAIEKTLSLASWFEQQGDCNVRLRTKTVGTVDDIIVQEGQGHDLSRIRRVSCMEVVITLK